MSTLPKSFQRIRHFGYLANRVRAEKARPLQEAPRRHPDPGTRQRRFFPRSRAWLDWRRARRPLPGMQARSHASHRVHRARIRSRPRAPTLSLRHLVGEPCPHFASTTSLHAVLRDMLRPTSCPMRKQNCRSSLGGSHRDILRSADSTTPFARSPLNPHSSPTLPKQCPQSLRGFSSTRCIRNALETSLLARNPDRCQLKLLTWTIRFAEHSGYNALR